MKNQVYKKYQSVTELRATINLALENLQCRTINLLNTIKRITKCECQLCLRKNGRHFDNYFKKVSFSNGYCITYLQSLVRNPKIRSPRQ